MGQRTNSIIAYVLLVLLLACLGKVRANSKATMGQWLTNCGESVMSCATDCAFDDLQSTVPCLANCGTSNLLCMGACTATKLPEPSPASQSPMPEREREMGIWDYMNSATDKLKRNAPDVTAVKHAVRSTYDYSWSAVTKIDNAVRVYAPDVTAVKHACRSTYDYSWSAVTKIDNAVRVTAVHKLNNIYLPDEKARSEIVQFANSFAKNAAIFTFHESLKAVPGGRWIYSITSRTVRDYSKSEDCKDEIKELQSEIIQLKKEFMGYKKSFEQSEICNQGVESESQNAVHLDSNLYKKSEDVIRIFMMKEFMGTHFLNDLIVPGVRSAEKPK